MFNRKAKAFVMLLCCALVLAQPICFAAESSDSSLSREEQIDALFNQKAEYICTENYDAAEKIDQELEKLGVEKLTSEEVYSIVNNSATITPRVDIPSMNNVSWSSSTSNVTRNGITYNVQILYAQPNSQASSLKGTSNYSLSSSRNWTAGTMNLIESAALSAAGKIPGASIILSVYDAVKSFASGISTTTQITNAQILYSCAYTETVKFVFVKESGQADNLQQLSFKTSSVTVAVGYQFPTFNYNGGSVSPNVIQGSRTITATPTGYSNPTYYALNKYTGTSSADRSYVSSITVTGPESKSVLKLYPLCPEYPTSVY